MSAFIVSSAHIDVLVLASVQWGLISRLSRESLTELGTSLWAENHRSVNHRYDGDEQPPLYAAPTAEVVLDPVAVVKAVDCYVYQSYEHPQWTDSPPARHCTRLREAALRGLDVEQPSPGQASGKPYPVGYDEAVWSIESITDACSGAAASTRGVR